jgi:glyoxylase-like metal-dependent hydrolase (beta-lactamase superfamily II)
MLIKTFIFNKIRTCTYVVSDESGECVFIDAGCESADEQNRIAAYIAEQKLTPVAIYNTHAHPDHVVGNAFLCQKFGIGNYLYPAADNYWVEHVVEHGATIDMRIEKLSAPLPYGSEAHFGNTTLQVLHTPGHSKDCVSLYATTHKVVFTGDTLFAGCIGRTDLYGGDYDEIMHSICTKLLTLPDETRVLAGHGYPTDIGTERMQNPFLRKE